MQFVPCTVTKADPQALYNSSCHAFHFLWYATPFLFVSSIFVNACFWIVLKFLLKWLVYSSLNFVTVWPIYFLSKKQRRQQHSVGPCWKMFKCSLKLWWKPSFNLFTAQRIHSKTIYTGQGHVINEKLPNS